MASDADWAKAFATQAMSDLNVREVLVDSRLPRCHQLHYFQMASEKVCKAYLIRENGYETVRRSHAYVESVLPVLVRHYAPKIASWQMQAIKKLAREIELLAPACDDGESRPDNSEYPWLDATEMLQTPCLHKFTSISSDPRDRTIAKIVQILRSSAQDIAGLRSEEGFA